jgi:hypothetical protein
VKVIEVADLADSVSNRLTGESGLVKIIAPLPASEIYESP